MTQPSSIGSYEREATLVAATLVRSRELPTPPDACTAAGTRLPTELKRFFESALAHDLDRVRIRADDRAAAAAARAGALAATAGYDIAFAPNAYAPHTKHGLELLAHELVHVVQQTVSRRSLAGGGTVRARGAPTVQYRLDPQRMLAGMCPPGTAPVSVPSTRRIGTAYGKWLGLMYMLEPGRAPTTYGLVDSIFFTPRSWRPGWIVELLEWDPTVLFALMSERWGFAYRRTDILDSDLDEVYEIKPLRSARAGPEQLAAYLRVLRRYAPFTSPSFGPPRKRKWHGGLWNPMRYAMIVPTRADSGGRAVCVIHAWRDPATPGLLVYDIVCCRRPKEKQQQKKQEQEQEVRVPRLHRVIEGTRAMQPGFARALQNHLPVVPKGAQYVFLAPPRFFQTFVLDPWDAQHTRMLQKMYGARPGPVFHKFALDLYLLAKVLPGPAADIAAIVSGWMTGEQVVELYKAQAREFLRRAPIAAAAALAVAAVFVGAPEVLAAAAVGAQWLARLGPLIAPALAYASSDGLPTTGDAQTPAARGPLLGYSEGAIEVGRTLPPWSLSAQDLDSDDGWLQQDVVGLAVVTAVVAKPGSAEQPRGEIIGGDPICLAPAELVVPRRGKIELGAEVTYGDERFFIVGLASPEDGG